MGDFDLGAEFFGGKRHLGQGDDQAAVGNVMYGSYLAGLDQVPDEVAMALLAGEIDAGRRTRFLPEDLPKIHRSSQDMSIVYAADQQDRVTRSLEGRGHLYR